MPGAVYTDKGTSPNGFVTSCTTQLDCAYARVAATQRGTPRGETRDEFRRRQLLDLAPRARGRKEKMRRSGKGKEGRFAWSTCRTP
jgi:hypothetical protein